MHQLIVDEGDDFSQCADLEVSLGHLVILEVFLKTQKTGKEKIWQREKN